ncbi:hypothetical protein ACFX1Q_008394 [Malus domestica]
MTAATSNKKKTQKTQNPNPSHKPKIGKSVSARLNLQTSSFWKFGDGPGSVMMKDERQIELGVRERRGRVRESESGLLHTKLKTRDADKLVVGHGSPFQSWIVAMRSSIESRTSGNRLRQTRLGGQQSRFNSPPTSARARGRLSGDGCRTRRR